MTPLLDPPTALKTARTVKVGANPSAVVTTAVATKQVSRTVSPPARGGQSGRGDGPGEQTGTGDRGHDPVAEVVLLHPPRSGRPYPSPGAADDPRDWARSPADQFLRCFIAHRYEGQRKRRAGCVSFGRTVLCGLYRGKYLTFGGFSCLQFRYAEPVELAERLEPVERVRQLVTARAAYTGEVAAAYDEVVEEVAARAAAAGSLGKLDLGGLTAWKRLRADTPWMSQLMGMRDADVRIVTRRAAVAARDASVSVPAAAAAARSALVPLPGFAHGDALASAVCFALAPDLLAVYDKRADRGLEQLGLAVGHRSGRYGRYMSVVEQCRLELADHGHAWSARQVDLALFQLGRSRTR